MLEEIKAEGAQLQTFLIDNTPTASDGTAVMEDVKEYEEEKFKPMIHKQFLTYDLSLVKRNGTEVEITNPEFNKDGVYDSL